MAQIRRNLRLHNVLDLTVKVGDPQPLPKNPLIKVICTMAENTQPAMVLRMLNSGMNVLRCNLHHGSIEAHGNTLKSLRSVLEQHPEKLCGVMVDISGDARVGKIKKGQQVITAGADVTISSDPNLEGDSECFTVLHLPPLSEVLKTGSSIVLNDGVSSFTVVAINKEKKTVRVRANANLTVLEHKILYVGIDFAVHEDVDFLAVSVSSPEQVHQLRQLLVDRDRMNMKLIIKIGSNEALENVRELVELGDGIMVSRGDLGIIMPEQQVFVAQKHLVSLSNASSKPCIITTQMLYSMIRNPRPTRAEATDVANAVLDGADCVMLSSETETGDYPIEALEMMVHICQKAVLTELQMDHYEFFESMLARTRSTMQMNEVVAAYAVRTALELKAAALVTITETGNTTRRIVKYRPPMPVIALTPSAAATRSMLITRAAVPYHVRTVNNSTAIIAMALERAKEQGLVKVGDKIVAVLGDVEGLSGSSNTFKVMTVI